jgi:RNA polymerase sigma-70 factor (ECF subfamily)
MRAWLFGIAHHRCLDEPSRRLRKQDRCDPIESVEHSLDAVARPDDIAAANERGSALHACLDELSAESRAAVLLRYQEGMTYPEMAIVFGALVATLQARVIRALPVLRRCLERKGVRP